VTQDQKTAAVATIADVVGLRNRLRAVVFGILLGVLAQTRSARVAMDYVDALLGDVAANCWALAQAAGHASPRRMQELLGCYVWDWADVRAALPGFAAAYLPCPADDLVGPGLAFDETADLKSGMHTVGVARQYAGITGQVENCVTTVFCTYVTAGGHCWVDWEPYLPEPWCADQARRAAAGVPADLEFATKPELAARMLKRRVAAGALRIGWVAADEVYGRSAAFRAACEEAKLTYVLTVPVDFSVATAAGTFRADELAAVAIFERRSAGSGSKGPRYYDWALVATTSPHHFLLIRRSISDPTQLAYFTCYVPEPTPATLTRLITIAGRRWPVEQDFQLGKSIIGWDTSQVRTHHAYQRHTALSALALAYTAAAQAQTTTLTTTPNNPPPADPPPADPPPADPPPANPTPPTDPPATEATIALGDAPLPRHPDQPCPPHIGLIKLSANETRRLINLLASTATDHAKAFGLAWSNWRRRHQAIARWHHWRTRLRALT
jgi:DDE superfamily endonuclease